MRSVTRMRLEGCAAVSTGRIRFYVATAMHGRVSTLGRVVDVAPHLSATFAVHEAHNKLGWCVSDTESGGRAGVSLTSEDGAIADAIANLATRTEADMQRARKRIRQLVAKA